MRGWSSIPNRLSKWSVRRKRWPLSKLATRLGRWSSEELWPGYTRLIAYSQVFSFAIAVLLLSPASVALFPHSFIPIPIGFSIGALAFLALIVTTRKEPTTAERAAWIVIGAILFIAETNSLYRQQRDTAVQQRIDRQASDQQLAAFMNLNKEMEETLKRSGQTLTKLDQVGDTSRKAARSAGLAVDNLTGASTYAIVIPTFMPLEDGHSFPLSIFCGGKVPRSPLSDVHLYIREDDEKEGSIDQFKELLAGNAPGLVSVGYVNPNVAQRIAFNINPPSIPNNKVTKYLVNVDSRNEPTLEHLWVKYTGKTWLYRSEISRGGKPLESIDWR